MRIAVLVDIHGNLEALKAVLDDARLAGAAEFYSLGDIVGYGPDPGRCLEIVRERATVSLSGNHDAAVAGRTPLEDFNEFARWSVEWTIGQLDAEQKRYLGSLPFTHRSPGLLLVHSSPIEPERWHYIHGLADVEEQFSAFCERLCFYSHSHCPAVYAKPEGGDAVLCDASRPVRLHAGLRYMVNAGSVGQPRDRDPRASYALYDAAAGSVRVRRVPYSFEQTQKRMRDFGIPDFLVNRLAEGY